MRKALPGLVGAALLAAPAAAQTVEELLERSLEARGGRAALAAVETVRMTGSIAMGEQDVPIVVEMKRPARFRVEITFQGTPSVQAWDGAQAWGIPPMALDAESLPAEAGRQLADQADFEGPLVEPAAKGHRVELAGRARVGDRDAWKLRVTRKGGDVEHFYLDATSCLPVRVESRRTVRGAEVEAETELADYREAGGVLWPFTIRNSARGRPEKQAIAFRRIEVNVPIDDGRFRMPATARPKR